MTRICLPNMIENTQDNYLKQSKIEDTDYKAILRKNPENSGKSGIL